MGNAAVPLLSDSNISPKNIEGIFKFYPLTILNILYLKMDKKKCRIRSKLFFKNRNRF